MRHIRGSAGWRRSEPRAADAKRTIGMRTGRSRRTGPLAGFELFQGLTADESRKVARRMEVKRFLRGEAIYRKDDPCDCLYALKEGLVKLISRPEKGAGTVIYLLRPTDIFGELLLAEERRLFDARALTDVAAGVLSREHFVEFLESLPRIRMNFIRLLSRRLVRIGRGITEFRHAGSFHRLARVLLRVCAGYGEETPGGDLLRVTLTHADLAEMIGTSRETVTNLMNRFRRLGLVVIRGHRLYVNRLRLAGCIRPGDIRRDGDRLAADESA